MKQRNLKKKVGSLLLAVAMLVTSFPAFSHEVHAAENQLLTEEQFATVKQLKSFNTNDDDGTKNPAKIYFGNNNQQWWIAGSQKEQGLTLFAASPLATNQTFETNYSQNKTYSANWECVYTGENPGDVYSNHYGASPLRNTLKGLETSYFTDAEQLLMNNTTVYTNDTKNSNTYSTTNKLYLAYGDYKYNSYITVGTNSRDSLNNGLLIDKNYWENSGTFWLRAPYLDRSSIALAALSGYCVGSNLVNTGNALVPAFELNLSSVIFASAANAASTEEKLTVTENTYTLRYASTTGESGIISSDGGSVQVKNAAGKFLVAQNNSGAYAKKINGNDETIAANQMGTGTEITNFNNCEVWIESTDTTNRITTARRVGVDSSSGSVYIPDYKIAASDMIVNPAAARSNVFGSVATVDATGRNRVETSLQLADQVKKALGVDKFSTIILASGTDFPDGLGVSALSIQQKAPVLIVTPGTEAAIKKYIEENLVSDGKVIISGGTGAVSQSMQNSLNGIDVTRLGGADRYKTNILTIKELLAKGASKDEVLIASGKDFADALSASATGKIIMIVGDNLTNEQKTLLEDTGFGKITILGGTGAISQSVENQLNSTTGKKAERVGGANRIETSKLIAARYFPGSTTNVYTKADGFADGLAGGLLANITGSPMRLAYGAKDMTAGGRSITLGGVK